MSVIYINSYQFASAAAPWTPAEITTGLWLDAADASTVQTTSGLVDQINDKSGNGIDFTATTTARPTYTASGQNGENVLTFNGTSNFLSRSAYIYGTTHSLFIVFKYTGASTITAATVGGTVMSEVGSDTAIYIGPWTGLFTDERLGYYRATQGFAKTDADIDATSPLLLSFAVNNSYTGAVANLNGSADFLARNTSSIPRSINNIGAYNSSAAFFTGFFCELVIAPSFLSGADIEKMEGYLAHKWGLAGNLPAAHPYKSTAPTV